MLSQISSSQNLPQKTTFIYGLWDPRNYQLRYIGKSDNPQERLKWHLRDAKHLVSSTHVYNWIRSLLREDLEPCLEILEEVLINDWEQSEKAWIEQCKLFGVRLTNMTDGGDGVTMTPEIRRKIGKANTPGPMKGRKHTPETIRKIIENRGPMTISDEERKARSERNQWRGKDGWMKGKRFTESHKQKISESHLGEKNPMFGKKQSEESIRRKVEKTKGLKRSDEFRKHISEVQKGKEFTEEHKQRLKEAWLKRKEKFGASGFKDESIEKMRQSQKKRRSK